MRLFCALFTGVLILGAPLFSAHATGNVLVPSTNTDLGVSSHDITTPAPTVPSETPTPAPQATPPNTTNNQSSSLSYTPAPAPVQAPTTIGSPQTTGGVKAQLADITQTRVMKLPTYPMMPDRSGMNLPNSVNIDVDPNWSANSIKLIADQLGIPTGQVPSVCRMSVRGGVATDKGGSPFDTVMTNHTTVKYDGKITIIVLAPMGFCSTSYPLPPNKGVIVQINDAYMVSLGQGVCQIAMGTKIGSNIFVSNPTNSTWQCKF